jgi:hypothetical protein
MLELVIVSKDSDPVTMSGTLEDAEQAIALRSKMPSDYIWFKREGKIYITLDQATINLARALWEPWEECERGQADSDTAQKTLASQHGDWKATRSDEPTPEATVPLRSIREKAEQGSPTSADGEGRSEIATLAGRIDELQRELDTLEVRIAGLQSRENMRCLYRSSEMKRLLDDAVARGLAHAE